MGRDDCKLVHQEGNMQAVVSGAAGIVTHVIRGGSDTMAKMKEQQYRAQVEQGDVVLEQAQNTARFTGRG